MLDEEFWNDFAPPLAAEAGENPVELPEGVELVRRSLEGRSLAFLMNHKAAAAKVDCTLKGASLLDGSKVDGPVELEPFGVEIIEETA